MVSEAPMLQLLYRIDNKYTALKAFLVLQAADIITTQIHVYRGSSVAETNPTLRRFFETYGQIKW